MKVIYNKFIPFKGYKCINIFGLVFARKGSKVNTIDLNHEYIHTAQMRDLMYVGFYIWYIVEYLIRLIIYFNHSKAYHNISFEQEAYEYECKIDYVQGYRLPYTWFKYISWWNKENI